MVIGCIKGVAVLSGFSYEKMYGCFTGTKKKKTGRNNEVTAMRGSTSCMLF